MSYPARRPAAQLKWLYTHTGWETNEELEDIMLVENHDIAAKFETGWDDSYDWSVAIESCKLFRRDRQGRSAGSLTS